MSRDSPESRDAGESRYVIRRLAKWAGLTIGLLLLLFVALVAY